MTNLSLRYFWTLLQSFNSRAFSLYFTIVCNINVTRNVKYNDKSSKTTDNHFNSTIMKYQIVLCDQCGNEFKRTNARHIYCSNACRVAAHRDRHGYEQPIFTYPSIRAVDSMRTLDTNALHQIKLYALLYLKSQRSKGLSPLTTQSELDVQTALTQIQMEIGDDENLNEINRFLAPLTDLIELIQNIQEDAPEARAEGV